MNDDPEASPSPTKRQRVADVLFGVGFVGLAAMLVVASDVPGSPWVLLAALVVGGLGADALLSALRDRRSLVSRIGPLP